MSQALAAVQSLTGFSQAAALMEPTRLRIVRALVEPNSATGLAKELRLPRQKVNYHLRTLEKCGLVRLVEERRKRNCTERVVQATARSYVVSPQLFAELGGNEVDARDRFSSAYLISLAARAVSDVAELRTRADEAGKILPTLAIESEVRFSNPQALHDFAEALATQIARLAAEYHDESAPEGRVFRFVMGSYPKNTRRDAGDEAPSPNPREELA